MYRDKCVSDIVLLNVQEPLEAGRAAAFHRLDALRRLEARDGEAALQEARRIRKTPAPLCRPVKVGDIARTIADTAAANDCDAIVMGTAARSPMGALFAGHLSNRLLRLSRVPVTLVR